MYIFSSNFNWQFTYTLYIRWLCTVTQRCTRFDSNRSRDMKREKRVSNPMNRHLANYFCGDTCARNVHVYWRHAKTALNDEKTSITYKLIAFFCVGACIRDMQKWIWCLDSNFWLDSSMFQAYVQCVCEKYFRICKNSVRCYTCLLLDAIKVV